MHPRSFLTPTLFEGEPVLWVGGEYLHGRVSADASVGHFGYNILQNVSIAMTTIADLKTKQYSSTSCAYKGVAPANLPVDV